MFLLECHVHALLEGEVLAVELVHSLLQRLGHVFGQGPDKSSGTEFDRHLFPVRLALGLVEVHRLDLEELAAHLIAVLLESRSRVARVEECVRRNDGRRQIFRVEFCGQKLEASGTSVFVVELLLKAKLPVGVLEGLHDELVQIIISPVPDSKTVEWTIINPENLVTSVVTIDSQSRSSDHAWIDEDSLPVDFVGILVEAVANTLDGRFNVDGFNNTIVGDVGFVGGLAFGTVFPLSKFGLSRELTCSLHVSTDLGERDQEVGLRVFVGHRAVFELVDLGRVLSQ